MSKRKLRKTQRTALGGGVCVYTVWGACRKTGLHLLGHLKRGRRPFPNSLLCLPGQPIAAT